ncbi:F0F1 ATP synthase subunit gamma [Ferrovum sp. PN-J185]|uniref:F0F1 ATP synthase subunit gamma n=1 Tax=Ferrovum sp. PN-J185 TaxID=1356306 RepID=UPI000796BE8A|nr:F0F1 ATP synthase subunit gamma [Ferrovum sp. PN-J185]KXW55906.1 ATP synthase gamma chain [Ferrovum sp. PN-J185]MCC6068705.1 F0F1 ATP synthase subunit gamma [Ferrovum sp. PN-J185]MDE1891890.1 F0F1 ATP synthase subunit gamma [Betaproteobacteria bacterium]MDE2056742.1 F0F1 ATP synthase subunit gamma [Betaproteobacteria bacterium]
MAGSKEIRMKIKSVQNTRKITKAMEMVAASKMRKAQDRMRATRPYGEKIRQVAAHLSTAHPEYQHPYLVQREKVKSVGFILVSSDKGLCGGLNTNVLRQLTQAMKKWENQGASIELVTIGNKGLSFMQRMGGNVIAQVTQLGDTPHLEKLIGPVKVMLDRYTNGEIDAVYIAYNRFINTMKQEPTIEPLLPLAKGELKENENQVNSAAWDYIYEPDPKAVIDELMVRYVEALVYQAVTENIASEQSARMVAMKAASDNAGNVIGELQLIYNKSRQAAITKELSEIVGGAAAV